MKARVQNPSSLRPPMSSMAATGRGESVMKASKDIVECSVAQVEKARSASPSRCALASIDFRRERVRASICVAAK